MPECLRCGVCCKNFHFSMKLPDKEKRIEDFLLRRNKHPQGYWHMKPDGVIHLMVFTPCELLEGDNICTVHNDKPELCKVYLCDRARREKHG